MKVLVVTGGIGSGKSYVCRILEEKYGIPVYEADIRAKRLYNEYPGMLDSIEETLGVILRTDDGVFAPHLLADVIFNDAEALKKVEDILFPVLMNDFNAWAEKQGTQTVAMESATLLEKSQFDGFGDITVLVDAPVDVRLARAMSRDGASKEKIMARMQAQSLMNALSNGATTAKVDHVLLNDSSEADLEVKLDDFIEKYALTKML